MIIGNDAGFRLASIADELYVCVNLVAAATSEEFDSRKDGVLVGRSGLQRQHRPLLQESGHLNPVEGECLRADRLTARMGNHPRRPAQAETR